MIIDSDLYFGTEAQLCKGWFKDKWLKIKYLAFNPLGNTGIVARAGRVLGKDEDKKYLDSWVSTTHKDVKIRKAEVLGRQLNLVREYKLKHTQNKTVTVLCNSRQSLRCATKAKYDQ